MAEDSTWLKKDLTNYPLKRNLKTSLLRNVSHQEMDSSLLSNPEKSEKPDVFIPRMLQNKSRMSRAHKFKVPKLPMKENLEQPGMSRKSVMIPVKSFLPVPATKTQNEPPKTNLSRPSIITRTLAPRSSIRRKCMQRLIELSEEKKPQSQVASSDNSVIRSILKKKRASLKKSLESGSQPKSKKVLFDGLEDSFVEGKENYLASSPANTHSGHFVVPEPPFSNSSSFLVKENQSEDLEDDSEEPELLLLDNPSLGSVLELFSTYKEKMSDMQKMHDSLENYMNSILRHTLATHNDFQSVKKNFDEVCSTMEKLGEELEEKLKKIISGSNAGTPRSRKIKSSEVKKTDKLGLSDKSRAIKGSSKKRGSLPMREILKSLGDTDKFTSWKKNS